MYGWYLPTRSLQNPISGMLSFKADSKARYATVTQFKNQTSKFQISVSFCNKQNACLEIKSFYLVLRTNKELRNGANINYEFF